MPKAGSSIRVRSSGRYEARYRGTDGKVRGKAFATEKEAKAFLIDVRKQVQDNTWSDPDLGRQSFAAVADQWLAHERSKAKARPTTIDRYAASLRLYAEPALGSRQIAGLTSSDLERWAHRLPDVRGRAVAPRTVRSAFFPVQAVFAYAARHKVIRYNPCADVDLPAASTAVTGHFLSRTDVAALADTVAAVDPAYGLLLRFAAGVGLRASETTGLRVKDVRLAARQVDVVRTVKKAHPAGWTVDEPKSKRSSRTIPILDDDLLADVIAYLAAHPRREDGDAPLWPGRNTRGALDYGTPGEPRYWNQAAFYRNVFRPAVAAVGLSDEPRTGVRWHDLRHTAISQWLEDGHPMYEVSRWAGHSSLNFTDAVYAKIADKPDYSAALARTRLAKAAKTATVLPFPTAEGAAAS